MRLKHRYNWHVQSVTVEDAVKIAVNDMGDRHLGAVEEQEQRINNLVGIMARLLQVMADEGADGVLILTVLPEYEEVNDGR